MQKVINQISISLLGVLFATLLFTDSAQALDLSNWYTYQGSSASHTFALNYPEEYNVVTSGDNIQRFVTPGDVEALALREFEGKTYKQAINSYVNNDTAILSTTDFVFPSETDLLGKKVSYQNSQETFEITFIKRGSLIISLTAPQTNTAQAIYDSFRFTDQWHQYIDYGDNYTFIFPKSLSINPLSKGVSIEDSDQYQGEIFQVLKYSESDLSQAASLAAKKDEEFQNQREIFFHNIPAILATYLDTNVKKSLARVIVSHDNQTFSLTSTNISPNFPHFNYYDTYLLEMLESFEFFDISGEQQTYLYFPDVRDSHPNQKAINALSETSIVNGYPDGNFRPEGLINRAELTKMNVASSNNPDSTLYKDCFTDVTDQWFAPYICYAKEQGWVTGYKDRTFKPEQNISRVEALKIIIEALFPTLPTPDASPTAGDIKLEQWYTPYFIFAEINGLLDKQHVQQSSDQSYLYFPNDSITRKEVAETLYRSLQLDL